MNGIPPGNRNPEKPAILRKFIEGVNKLGMDNGQISRQWSPMMCDVAVLQGFVHENSKKAQHLQLRKEVLELQNFNNKRTIIIDSNLFLYRDPGNTKKYLRYSYDGVFPTTGEYCNGQVDPSRWEKIKSDLNFDLQPWKLNKGRYILLCAQRDGGWSMQGKSVVQWVRETVADLRKITQMPIHIRLHPGDGRNNRHVRFLENLQNVTIVDVTKTSLLDNLQEAWATVVYNSSPAVASVIEGVPTFITDPNPKNCQAYGVTHIGLKDILNPQEFDRSQWILRMAQMHWNQNDLSSGECWKWMRQWAQRQ
jgi:hypothetical protein